MLVMSEIIKRISIIHYCSSFPLSNGDSDQTVGDTNLGFLDSSRTNRYSLKVCFFWYIYFILSNQFETKFLVEILYNFYFCGLKCLVKITDTVIRA